MSGFGAGESGERGGKAAGAEGGGNEKEGGSGLRARVRSWAAGSAWAPLVTKALGYLAGFAGLALVGSGALGGVSSKVPGVEAPAAQAAGSSSAPGFAHPPDAGPPPDAGAAGTASSGPQHGAADAGVSADGGGGGGITQDGKVVLNLATEEDLRRLPGIGAAKAKAIVELRTRIGRFRRAEDLLRVKGIGRRRLARLRPLLLVDPPKGEDVLPNQGPTGRGGGALEVQFRRVATVFLTDTRVGAWPPTWSG